MELTRCGFPRVVVTGMSVVSPLGHSVETFWENLKKGMSGVKKVTSDLMDTRLLEVQIAAYIDDFDPDTYVSKKESRRIGRCAQFTLAATRKMLADSGLTEEDLARDCEASGVVVGTGLGSFDTLVEGIIEFRGSERFRPRPFGLAMGLTNMQAHYVSRETKAVGPIIPVTSACAAGTQALIQGVELIRSGKVKRVFAGGTDSTMTDYALAVFDSMMVVARGYNDNPTQASRPFDLKRAGFVYSEGASMLVLETLETALARDAHIHAEVLGGATSSDAYHIAALDPNAQGMTRCIRWALQDAKVTPEEIDYINAHGTGTPANDRLETLAIKQVFGEHAYSTPISSTKSMIGHCMGAAGALEAVVTIKSLQEGIIHPTINYETPDPDCDLDYVPNTPRETDLKLALSNSFGLGGQNASLVLAKW